MAKRFKRKKTAQRGDASPPPLPDASIKTKAPAPGSPGPVSLEIVIQALTIVGAALWIYWPILRGDWLWDDNKLITDNLELRNLQGLANIWVSAPVTSYWPLTWTVLWVEWHLFGSDPLGYHIVSLALHLSSGLLIWRVFTRLGLRWSWLGGLLFVIHPLAVESVAWNSEIKNTLSLPLFLLSCDAWLDAEREETFAYLRSILYYLAAMLAKASTVMLPAVLLLYCWWRGGGITRREIIRMIPYGVIAVALGCITIYFQDTSQEITQIELGGLLSRSVEAGTALCFYMGKFIWPLDLLPIYPRWPLDPPSLLQLLTLPALAMLLAGLWAVRESGGRHALFGLGFFVVTLLPVLGFVKMEYFLTSWVADHLVYLPMIGLVGLVVAGLEWCGAKASSALPPGKVVVGLLLILLAWESRTYACFYINQEALWTYTLRLNPLAWEAHYNLGCVLARSGREDAAMEQFGLALEGNPDFADAHTDLGNVLAGKGRFAEAVEQYQAALKLGSNDSDVHYDLGVCLLQMGGLSEALQQFKEAVRLHPGDAEAHEYQGQILMRLGRFAEAVAQFAAALKIDPDNARLREESAEGQARLRAVPVRT